MSQELNPGDRCIRLPDPDGGKHLYGKPCTLVRLHHGPCITVNGIKECTMWIVYDDEVPESTGPDAWGPSYLLKLPDDDMRKQFEAESKREYVTPAVTYRAYGAGK